jgi:hypothetical protein
MNQPESIQSIDRESLSQRSAAQQARAMGSPLPMGSGRRPVGAQDVGNRVPSSPPGRALPGLTSGEEPSGVQRAMNAFRAVMPIVQRLLPLLEGNVITAISNVLAPRPQAPPPPPKVDLAPLESGVAELQTQHRGLREQVIEQNASLKRVEDQLEMVQEATDRNTLVQQELLEDLRSFSSKVKVVAIVGISVLAIGVVLNLILFMHIERVLP